MRTRLLSFLVAAAALVPGTASAQTYRSPFTMNYGNPAARYYVPNNYGNPPLRNFGNPSATPIITAPNTAGVLNSGTLVPFNATTLLPGTPLTGLGTALVTPPPPTAIPIVTPVAGAPAGTPDVGAFVTPPAGTPPPENVTNPPTEVPTPGVTTGVTPAGTAAVGSYGMPMPTSGYGISPLVKTPTASPFAPTSAATQPSYLGSAPTVRTTYVPAYAAPQVQSTFYAPLRRVYGASAY